MGCVIVLLAAILCTLLFGPVPVLVIGGVALAYGALAAICIGIGNAAAAIRQAWKFGSAKSASPARAEPPAASMFLGFDDWASRNPIEAGRAKAAQAAWEASEQARQGDQRVRQPARTPRYEPVFFLLEVDIGAAVLAIACVIAGIVWR